MSKIIAFCKELGCSIGIQNFLEYSRGRNPALQMSFDEFMQKLQSWEKEFCVSLINPDYGFEIRKDAVLQKPFKRGDIVVGEYVFSGYISARDRLINVINMTSSSGKVKVQILGDKYNTFSAKVV